MKNRAFVRYNAKGEIVPGSLIVTGGTKPQGPAVWKEVSVDLNYPPSFTLAHATDFHLKNNAVCNARLPLFKAALTKSNPDVIFATGDMIDAQGGNADQVTLLGTLLTDLNKIAPTYVARGNHDPALTNEQLTMSANYYYVDIQKWRFIVLFSQQAAYEDAGSTYTINSDWRFGATQLTWLADTIDSTPNDMSVCVISHVPILGVGSMMWWITYYSANPVTNLSWNPTVDQMKDVFAVTEIFRTRPKVKLCLSGHEHIYSEEEYLGVKYVNSGAVCANWWNDSSYQEKHHPAGYRLIKFFNDGTFSVGKMLTY